MFQVDLVMSEAFLCFLIPILAAEKIKVNLIRDVHGNGIGLVILFILESSVSSTLLSLELEAY